jgi:uncharacterized protein
MEHKPVEKRRALSPRPGKVERQLRSFFRERRGVLLAFLFGSVPRGRATDQSDVDVAVLFEQRPEMREINRLRDDLASMLGQETDVVVLNTASPIVKMQVLKHGTVLFELHKKFRYRFFQLTIREYDDLKRVRRLCEESILRGRIYA